MTIYLLTFTHSRLSIRLWHKDSRREEVDTQEHELQMALRYLGSETMLSLIRNIGKVTEHVEGIKYIFDLCFINL